MQWKRWKAPLHGKLYQRDKIDLETYKLKKKRSIWTHDLLAQYLCFLEPFDIVCLNFCSFSFAFSETGYSWPFFCLL